MNHRYEMAPQISIFWDKDWIQRICGGSEDYYAVILWVDIA